MAAPQARVRIILQRLLAEHLIAGALVTVAEDGVPPWTVSEGWLDASTQRPLADDTIFRIYSMTKPVVSAAALILCQQGHLRLDAPAADWAPALGRVTVFVDGSAGSWVTEPPRRPITVRDLLRHTAGFSYGVDRAHPVDQEYQAAEVMRPRADLATTIERLATIPLRHHPGEKFLYGLATDVLGRVCEVASDMPLDALLQKLLFDPLEMQDTGFQVPLEHADRLAALHRRGTRGSVEAIEPPHVSRYLKRPVLLSGGAGLLSTASDYLRFASMLAQHGQFGGRRLLESQWIEEMTTNQLPGGASVISVGMDRRPGVGFGLGVYVRVAPSDREPHSLVGDYGWSGSGGTHYWRSPRTRRTVIIMQQYMPYTSRLKRAVQEALSED